MSKKEENSVKIKPLNTHPLLTKTPRFVREGCFNLHILLSLKHYADLLGRVILKKKIEKKKHLDRYV